MTDTTFTHYAKPSAFLRDLDSHGIYSVSMLAQCLFRY